MDSHLCRSPFIHSPARYLACLQKFLPVRELEPVRKPDVKFREPYRHARERAPFAYGTEHTAKIDQGTCISPKFIRTSSLSRPHAHSLAHPSPMAAAAYRTFPYAPALLFFLSELSELILVSPRIRLLEASICRSHYLAHGNPSGIINPDDGSIDESL